MHAQRPYILPIKGLKPGLHEYKLTADTAFFASFNDSPVQHASLEVVLRVDKRHRELVLSFDFEGSIQTECDRCLGTIDLPVSGQAQLFVQISDDPNQISDDPDLLFVSPDDYEINTAPFAYEYFLLSIPMVKTFDCRSGEPPYPCNQETLNRIEALLQKQETVKKATDDNQPSPWDNLKNWNKN